MTCVKFLKTTQKGMCFISIFALTIALSFAQPAGAETFYTFNGHKLSQGIGNVDCLNSVSVNQYPYLWGAVEDAIKDWDWHLGLLNEQYNVNWNLTKYSENGNYPTIEFIAMTDGVYFKQFTDYYSRDINIFTKAVTRLYKEELDSNGNRSHASFRNEDWTTTQIVFLTDRWGDPLEDESPINDYYELKTTANHEIGHVLGLAHDPNDKGVIMYETANGRTATVPTLKDLETVYYLYKG